MEKKDTKPKKREKKQLLEGEVIRLRKGLPRTNKPVELPNNPTWLKQSNIVTLMSYDFKTIQIRVLIALIEKMQGAIEESILRKVSVQQLSLFQEFSDKEKIFFTIRYKDLGISPDQYPEVRSALKQLATIPVEFDTKDPATGADSWAVSGLFKAYIPKTNYNKTFTIEMDKEVAQNFVNVDRGFTKFIKEIAFSSQSKYTVRMYMLISSWKDKGGFSIKTEKFRKWLRLEDKYPNFKDLYKRIIRPVYEELFEKANCWFEMAEVYKNDDDKEPYKLNFKVIRSALSPKEKEQLEAQITQIKNLSFRYLQMEDKHFENIIPLINLNNCTKVLTKVMELAKYVSEHRKEIQSVPNYCTQAILKEVEIVPGFIGEEEVLQIDTENEA